jgi:O-antigen/teichoic acid export membrane protein
VRLARAATWLAVGHGIHASSAFVLPIILVRVISQADYGYFKQLDLAAGLLTPLILFGFDKSITYFLPRRESIAVRETSTPILAMTALTIAAAAAAMLAPGLFGRVFGAAPIMLLVATAVAYASSASISQCGQRALIAFGRARLAGLLPAILGVPRTVVLVLVALLAPSLANVLWATLGFAIIQIGYVLVALARNGLLTSKFEMEILTRHLRYGGALFVGSLAQTWSTRIDRYLISSAFSPERFAVYAVGKLNIPLLPIISQSLSTATAPRYSKLESEGRHRDMAVLWKESVEATLPLVTLVTFCMFATAQWVIPFLFTDAYADAVPVLRVFVFTYIVQTFLGVELILRALAALRFLLITIFASLVVRTVLGLLVLQTGDLPLQAGVQLAVAASVVVIRLVFIKRRLEVRWTEILPSRGLGLTLPLAAIGLAATWGVGRWVGDARLPAIAASGAIWGAIGVLALWRQGLWRKLLPQRAESRVHVDPTPAERES